MSQSPQVDLRLSGHAVPPMSSAIHNAGEPRLEGVMRSDYHRIPQDGADADTTRRTRRPTPGRIPFRSAHCLSRSGTPPDRLTPWAA